MRHGLRPAGEVAPPLGRWGGRSPVAARENKLREMALARTTSAAVEGILGDNYGPSADGSIPSLQPYIDSASNIITQVMADAVRRNQSIDTVTAELMERWLAAHLYTKMDPTYSSKSTQGASGSFVRGNKEPEPYKDGAIAQDPTGLLAARLNRQTARGIWLGRPPSAQTPYDQRN